MVEGRQINDCWNEIGVWAKTGKSCPRLANEIHCRNCHVYSEAARLLLDHEIPDEARDQWKEVYARPVIHSGHQGELYIIFRVSDELLALPGTTVKKVSNIVATHPLPHRNNPSLCGVANIDGEFVVVVSLASILGIESSSDLSKIGEERQGDTPRMISLEHNSNSFALQVDEIIGLQRFEESDMQPLPSTLQKALQRYVKNTIQLDDRYAGVLDLELFNYSVELAMK